MRRVNVAVLTVCAALVAVGAHADPRGVSTAPEPLTQEQIEAQRVQKVADIDAWLRRLPGRFRYVGTEEVPPYYCTHSGRGTSCTTPLPREVQGMWDCVGIGTGSGLHCVLGSMAQRREPMQPNMDSPMMILFGIDPDAPGIRYLRFDSDGIASESFGYLRGDQATFRTPCINPVTVGCTRIVKIHAAADGKPIRMSIEIERASAGDGYEIVARLEFKLRAMPEGQGKGDGERRDEVSP